MFTLFSIKVLYNCTIQNGTPTKRQVAKRQLQISCKTGGTLLFIGIE
jgi:hypothetical protein